MPSVVSPSVEALGTSSQRVVRVATRSSTQTMPAVPPACTSSTPSMRWPVSP
ncbi:hypothetical protein [Piscinibacter sp.]|uniref:hypothetical protein n=1 Tax=Piscinibacter sp. TaxID=1903157 RepID=UPI0039E475F0